VDAGGTILLTWSSRVYFWNALTGKRLRTKPGVEFRLHFGETSVLPRKGAPGQFLFHTSDQTRLVTFRMGEEGKTIALTESQTLKWSAGPVCNVRELGDGAFFGWLTGNHQSYAILQSGTDDLPLQIHHLRCGLQREFPRSTPNIVVAGKIGFMSVGWDWTCVFDIPSAEVLALLPVRTTDAFQVGCDKFAMTDANTNAIYLYDSSFKCFLGLYQLNTHLGQRPIYGLDLAVGRLPGRRCEFAVSCSSSIVWMGLDATNRALVPLQRVGMPRIPTKQTCFSGLVVECVPARNALLAMSDNGTIWALDFAYDNGSLLHRCLAVYANNKSEVSLEPLNLPNELTELSMRFVASFRPTVENQCQ
jgi:hypothetical protein